MSSNSLVKTKESYLVYFRKILIDPIYFKVKLILLISSSLSLISIFYNTVLFSCQMVLLQNALLVYLATLMVHTISNTRHLVEKIKIGVPLAIILGIFPASITLLISNIHYYFFGGRVLAYSARGLVAPSITVPIILVELSSQVGSLIILLLMSAFAGFMASITPQRSN